MVHWRLYGSGSRTRGSRRSVDRTSVCITEGDGNTIGSLCLSYSDPDMSRLHARLITRNDAVWARQNSRNGIFINDKRLVQVQELRGRIGPMGDGPHVFTLRWTTVMIRLW